MKLHRSHYVGYGVLMLFMGIMTDASIRAFTKKSGSTGQDMVQIQQIRYDSIIALEEAKRLKDLEKPMREK